MAGLMGADTLELNLEPSAGRAVRAARYGNTSEIVPAWARELMDGAR